MPHAATSPPANSYDIVPYASHPFPQTHPARLATIAALFALPVPAVETARVLELGSAAGGNIIPMAYSYPDASFVGVDYSAVQIDEGRRTLDALHLRNIELRHADVLDIDASWGEFDFIICHGVYSWVPPHVQDKILAVAAERLTPNGIAHVSYNAYPGWHMRGIVRQMMRYHALRFEDPRHRVAEARRILDIIAKHAVSAGEAAYTELLKQEAERLSKCEDHYIYHEHLEDFCEPLYFHEFIRRAREKGLDYLGEAQLGLMAPMNFGAEANQALRSLARDHIELEQFMDFMRNRTFRETLLHRAGRTPSYELQPHSVWPMFIAGCARPQTPPVDLAAGVKTTFLSRDGQPLTTPLPLLKAALVELADHWPEAVAFDRLLEKSAGRLGLAVTERERTLLGRAILAVVTSSDLIEVTLEPSRFTVTPGERPMASALARHQAVGGQLVSTGRHEVARLGPTTQRIIQALNGKRDIAEVARLTKLPMIEVQSQIQQIARLALIIR